MGCVRLRQQVNVDRVGKTVSLRNRSAQAQVKDPELTSAQDQGIYIWKALGLIKAEIHARHFLSFDGQIQVDGMRLRRNLGERE